IYALQASDGTVRWQRTFPNSTFGQMQMMGHVLYAYVNSGQVDALEPSDGTVLWISKAPSSGLLSNLVITATHGLIGTVGYSPEQDWLVAIDRTTGATAWQRQIPGGVEHVITSN